MSLELTLSCAPGMAVPVAYERLRAAARCVLDHVERPEHDADIALDVRVIDAAESAELNGAYRDKPNATNVLSFPADAELPGLWLLGDLAICAPVVSREAAAQGKTTAAHFIHMLVHGVLHLLGFDHIGDDEAQAMEALERRIMAALGYDDPYRSVEPVLIAGAHVGAPL